MNSDPIILVLEDERAQILSLRAQLHGLGRLAEFMEPIRALDYVRTNICDAAIVDVGMPRASMDGLGFVRAVREFDRDLAIIIRTGNDSDRIADEAIELRAIKRAVKSKTSLADLRVSTRDAIRETRERREVARQARQAAETQARLAEALGAYDLRLAAADVHKGLVHGLRHQLTALSALSCVLQDDAAQSGKPGFVEHARKSAEYVARVVSALNVYLDSPWGDQSSGARAAVNLCLGAVRQYFRGSQRWSVEGKPIVLKELMSDTLVECQPLELVNGLRHLIEYLLMRAAPGTEVCLAATVAHDVKKLQERLAAAPVVLNREAVRGARPYVVFRATGTLPATELAETREAFSFTPESGRTGNLHVLGEVVAAAGGAVILERTPAGVTAIEAALAVSL